MHTASSNRQLESEGNFEAQNCIDFKSLTKFKKKTR